MTRSTKRIRHPRVRLPLRYLLPSAVGALLVAGLALVVADLARPSSSSAEAERLVRTAGLTDLVLATDARYLRNLALADLHAPFQDHPGALEHFPSGAVIQPPPHLRTLPLAPVADESGARLP